MLFPVLTVCRLLPVDHRALMGGTSTPPFPPCSQSHLHQLGTHHPVPSLNRSQSPQQIYHRTLQMHPLPSLRFAEAAFPFQIGDTELGLGLLAGDVCTV